MRIARAGRLRHKVFLQQYTVSSGAMGGVSGSWTTKATVRAEIKPLTGRENFKVDQINPETQVMITIRYGSEWKNIDSSWRVVDANDSPQTVYAILGVVNELMLNQTLTLHCEQGEKDG